MYALCEIQELAYQRDCDRSQGNLLQLLEFSISYNAIQSRYLQKRSLEHSTTLSISREYCS